MTQTNLSMKQKQNHGHREQTCGYQEGGKPGEGRMGSLGLADANYLHLEANKVLLYSTRNYIQYPVTNHNGKEYKKECIYMYN